MKNPPFSNSNFKYVMKTETIFVDSAFGSSVFGSLIHNSWREHGAFFTEHY